MSTQTNFDAMLRSYAPNKLFREEIIKRDWFLKNVERDDTWLGGALEVRFKGASASSVQFGGLTAAGDISQSAYVLGTVTNQPEIWGSLIFNEKDLVRHGKINEQNFLKILPGEVDDMMTNMSMLTSMCFTNGPKIGTLLANGTNVGLVTPSRIERFEVNQKVILQGTTQPAGIYYILSIDINVGTFLVSATRGGAVADVSAYTTADAAAIYPDGQQTGANQLTSLKNSLLSVANGGSTSLYGQSKLSYPYLQAINVSGSSITATNILAQIFAAQTTVRNRGKGNPNKIVVSYKHLGSILAALEAQKGAFRQADDMTANEYGWTEINIVGVKGKLTVVAIQEMDDDWMAIMDMSALKVYSNGFFRKRQNPDGREYYEIRNTSGYQYIVDIAFFGDMVLERPSRCGIIYSISY
jgi:hypothetical protein